MSSKIHLILSEKDLTVHMQRYFIGNSIVAFAEIMQSAIQNEFDYLDLALEFKKMGYEVCDPDYSDCYYIFNVDCFELNVCAANLQSGSVLADGEFHNPEIHISSEIDPEDFDSNDEKNWLSADNDFDWREEEARIHEEIMEAQKHMPRFVHDETMELTDDQKEKGRKIFDALCTFLREFGDKCYPPQLRISQDWEVHVEYGGCCSDSDYLDSAGRFMHVSDDNTYVVDLEYVQRCVPYIENGLIEAARFYIEEYGELPSPWESKVERMQEHAYEILSAINHILQTQDDLWVTYNELEMCVYARKKVGEKEFLRRHVVQRPVTDFISGKPGVDFRIDLDEVLCFAEDIAEDRIDLPSKSPDTSEGLPF